MTLLIRCRFCADTFFCTLVRTCARSFACLLAHSVSPICVPFPPICILFPVCTFRFPLNVSLNLLPFPLYVFLFLYTFRFPLNVSLNPLALFPFPYPLSSSALTCARSFHFPHLTSLAFLKAAKRAPAKFAWLFTYPPLISSSHRARARKSPCLRRQKDISYTTYKERPFSTSHYIAAQSPEHK